MEGCALWLKDALSRTERLAVSCEYVEVRASRRELKRE